MPHEAKTLSCLRCHSTPCEQTHISTEQTTTSARMKQRLAHQNALGVSLDRLRRLPSENTRDGAGVAQKSQVNLSSFHGIDVPDADQAVVSATQQESYAPIQTHSSQE